MVLSALQQVVVSAVLVLCVFVVMPRIFGEEAAGEPAGLRGAARPSLAITIRVSLAEDYTVQFVLNSFLYSEEGSPQALHRLHLNSENSDSNTYQSIQQMRNAMEKEIKSERTRGNGRELAFTLMPLYALGVGVFAAYKFLKMKSHEESLSKNEKSTEDKAKETEHQLLELEKHLAQTEKMLNSLLTQLDPLSNCVNTLACEQKDEIMTQLQSIRRLMKESGLDTSEDKMKDVGHICNEKLEDLIQSFTEHSQEKETDDREDDSNEDSCEEFDYKVEEHELCDEYEIHQFEPEEEQEMINKDSIESGEVGLRRRNRYE